MAKIHRTETSRARKLDVWGNIPKRYRRMIVRREITFGDVPKLQEHMASLAFEVKTKLLQADGRLPPLAFDYETTGLVEAIEVPSQPMYVNPPDELTPRQIAARKSAATRKANKEAEERAFRDGYRT